MIIHTLINTISYIFSITIANTITKMGTVTYAIIVAYIFPINSAVGYILAIIITIDNISTISIAIDGRLTITNKIAYISEYD